MELSKFDKLKQKLCGHKNAIPIESARTQLIGGGEKRQSVAKHYCVRCGLTFDKFIEWV